MIKTTTVSQKNEQTNVPKHSLVNNLIYKYKILHVEKYDHKTQRNQKLCRTERTTQCCTAYSMVTVHFIKLIYVNIYINVLIIYSND